MSFETEYAKTVKIPIYDVTITRFDRGDAPGVDSRGTNHYDVQVLDSSVDFSFGQYCANCTLSIISPKSQITGYPVIFKPMDRVVVRQGYNKTSTFRNTFFGFVDRVTLTNPPNVQMLECRDIIKLAVNQYIIEADEYVYWAETDDQGRGGQSSGDRQVEAIIGDFLEDSGIPTNYHNLDTTNITIGSNSKASFVYETALDAINRLCNTIQYRLWADPTGRVQLRDIRPYASITPKVTYYSSTYEYNNAWWDTNLDKEGEFVETQKGNLLNVIDASVSDESLRNWVTVIGYRGEEALTHTIVGDSVYIADPPRYRKAEVRSDLLDTIDMVVTIASAVYNDLNRLEYIATAEIEGDPRAQPGSTIRIVDPNTTGDGINYFLYGYNSRHFAGGWVESLDLLGGTGGPGAPPSSNQSPIAMFMATTEGETYAGEVWSIVTVDGSGSYDFDGELADADFVWTALGFSTRYGKQQTFVTTGIDSLTITLTVTDGGTPPLSKSVTQIVPLTSEDSILRAIYIASIDTVKCSTNGGETWNSMVLF